MKTFRLILFFLINVCLTNAQTLTVTTDKNPVIVGEQFILKFTVDAKAKDFKAPNFQGLRILGGPNSSSSSSYSFVNGESKSEITTTFSYYMSAPKEGSFTISPASVNANKKTILSKPLTINVVKGNQQKDNSLQKNLYIDVKTSKKNIYVGEQIIVTYKLHTRLELENTELTQLPNLNGFWKKDLESSSRFKREVINGIPYNTAIIKKTVLTPQKSGKLNIDPIKVTCSIRVNNQRNRRDPFSNFFNSYNVREEMISSKPIYVNVKELPQPDAAFNQAYGDLGQTKMDLIQGTLGAQFSDFDFNLPVIVTSFDIQVRGQLISNQGSELSPQAKGAIGAAPSGSVLSVENIKTAAIGSNVQVKDAKSFALIIN